MLRPSARLAPVDGLRGVAAVMVVLTHVYRAVNEPSLGLLSRALSSFGSGVDLFFVLSGFCLYYPLTKPDAVFDAREFFRRRARRILPPYYAAMLAVFLLPILLEPLARQAGLVTFAPDAITWRQIWTHLLMVHTLFPDTMFGIDGPFWTLGVEAQFYLAFPLAVWLVHRFGWRGVGMMAGLTIAYRLGVSNLAHGALAERYLGSGNGSLDVKADFFLGHWLEFALGMQTARLVRTGALTHIARWLEILALAAIVGVYVGAQVFLAGAPDRWLLPVTDPLYGLAFSALLLLACHEGSLSHRMLSRRVPVWLGTISYSLYLVHLPILSALGPSVLAPHLPILVALILMGALGIPVAVAAAAVFFWLFERPFLVARRPAAERSGSTWESNPPATPFSAAQRF